MVLNEAIKGGAVPEGYDEIDIEFIKFSNPGDKVMGVLVGKKEITLSRGNRVGKYTVKIGDNKKVSFLGSVQMDEKLQNVPLLANVWIEYTHSENVEGQTYDMKFYKVFVKAR